MPGWLACGSRAYLPFGPSGLQDAEEEPVVVYRDELEALRLVYLEGLTVEEAAKRMGVPRGRLWRLLDRGRRKIVYALVHGYPLLVEESNERAGEG